VDVERFDAEGLNEVSKAERERRMVTPWHTRLVGNWEALSLLLPV
jgi:hypothetical protein